MQLQRLYPITASSNRLGLSHLQLVEAFLRGGARLVQVRDKTHSDVQLYRELLQIREVCRRGNARLIVNDRLDLALAVRADGVHLGQTDLPGEVARKLLGPNAIIGISTHSRRQFEQACSCPVDYISVGPIFSTRSKTSEYEPLGSEFLEQVTRDSPHPVVAIGGIGLENAERVWNAGADSVAVISDVVNSPDPAERVGRFLNLARDRTK